MLTTYHLFQGESADETKSLIYIGIVIGLLIAWYYRADLKDIKDGLVPQIQKTTKLSPYTENQNGIVSINL